MQALYHSVSVVGTLLLQIGEVGQKFDKGKNVQNYDKEPGKDQVDGVVDESNEKASVIEEKEVKTEKNWSITFEQFFASILTEQSLVDHFSEKTDLQVKTFLTYD